MRHTEVSEAPGQGGEDHDPVVFSCLCCLNTGVGEEIQITGNRFCICHNGVPTAGSVNAENQNNNQREGHDKALDQAGDRRCHKAAHRAVCHDNNGGDDHRGHIVPTEHVVEQLAAGDKAGSGIGNKEDNYHQCTDDLDQLGVIPEAFREEIRNGDRVQLCGINAQPAGDEQPVQISAGSKPDSGPAGLSNTAEQRQTGNTHQQIGTHVGCFGAHGGNDGAKFASTEIKVGAVAGPFGMAVADIDHTGQVNNNGENNKNTG